MGDLISLLTRSTVFFVLFFVMSSGAYCLYACKVIDQAGSPIHLSRPAKRIISLAPDITEMIVSIGAGQALVGVMAPNDYPPVVRKIPLIGSYHGLDVERIVALKPDLIVTWGAFFSRELNQLKHLGIPIYTVRTRNLTDIPHTLRHLGCLSGHDAGAHQIAHHFSEELNRLKRKYGNQKPLRVFYQIGAYSLITINQESWIHEAITLCGGVNPFAALPFISPRVSWESMMVVNPEVVISDSRQTDWKKNWMKWPNIVAVNRHLLFTVDPDLIERAGPRLIAGIEQICTNLSLARVKLHDKRS